LTTLRHDTDDNIFSHTHTGGMLSNRQITQNKSTLKHLSRCFKITWS